MLHMIAYGGALSATSTSFQNLPGIADPTVTVSGNIIYVPTISNLVGEFLIGASVSRGELRAPSILDLAPLDVSPVNASATPSNPTVYSPHYTEPFKLVPTEGLQAYAINSSSTTDKQSIIVELSDGAVAPVAPTECFTTRATFTVPSGNYSWQNAALTFDNALPVGTYDLIGARVEVANGIAARFYPNGGTFRPGVTVRQSKSDLDVPFERRGGKGVLFTFNQLTPPTIDLYHNGATGTGVVFLDLVKKT